MTTKIETKNIPVSEVKEVVTETISSVEVSEMMETRHDRLMRKIEGISKDFSDTNIGVANYWTESTYKDAQNKDRKCYNITKIGCDFLAHKMTGKKGNIFTARYIQKFEELKETLEISSYQIADPIERAKKWIEEEMVRQAQAKQIEEQKPKVEYFNEVLDSDKMLAITDIAKDLGLTGQKLNSKLHKAKVIYPLKYENKEGKKVTKYWCPYSEYGWLIPDYRDYRIDKYGQRLKWTEKGRKWIIDFLKGEQ